MAIYETGFIFDYFTRFIMLKIHIRICFYESYKVFFYYTTKRDAKGYSKFIVTQLS